MHEATIRWIGSFLTDRSQRVRIGQVYSHPVTPNGGIPQGTKLAPLLFAILVNNLCRDWRYRIKCVELRQTRLKALPYLLELAPPLNKSHQEPWLWTLRPCYNENQEVNSVSLIQQIAIS